VAKHETDINTDFLCRELAAELRLNLNIVRPIVERIFLKILKHLLNGRDIRINGFGVFEVKFYKEKRLKNLLNKDDSVCPPRFVPRFYFHRSVSDLIKNSMAERAEEYEKEQNRE